MRLGTEVSRAEYGPATAAAVLQFKRERNILNTALRQTVPDDIVGKKTIAALDAEMLKKQLPPGRPPRVKVSPAPFVRLGFNSTDLQGSLVGLELNDLLGLGQAVASLPLEVSITRMAATSDKEKDERRAETSEETEKRGDKRTIQNADYDVIPVWMMGNLVVNNRRRNGVLKITVS